MFVLTAQTIALCILVPLCAFFIVKWLFTKDTEVENRRRAASGLAGKLDNVGLKRLPAILRDYSVGDYSGMAKKIHDMAELVMSGENVVLAEVETVFTNVLAAKLATPEGKALIAAKLAEINAVAK